MKIILLVVLGLVALAALFFVVAGVVITTSGIRARRGVKGDIALTGFFVACFVMAAGGCVLIALPNAAEQVGSQPMEQEATQPTGEKTEGHGVARREPAAVPDPSFDLDCKDFTSQEAAQKAFDQDLEDPNALDPDTDGTACEALAAQDPEPKPNSEKKPEKRSQKKPEPGKEPGSRKQSATENKPASEKEAKQGEKRLKQ